MRSCLERAAASQRWIRCRPHPLPRRGQHPITVSFLFVLFRVISWIACYAPRKAIHEITRNNTNEEPWQIRVLTQSLPRGGTDSLTSAPNPLSKKQDVNNLLRSGGPPRIYLDRFLDDGVGLPYFSCTFIKTGSVRVAPGR